MTTHVDHDDILEHGFCDDCPRCAQIVDDIIFRADHTLFMKYWEMTKRFMKRGGGYDDCQSELDKKAIRILEDFIDKAKRVDERLSYASVSD